MAMATDSPISLKVWAGVILFFGIGVAIALVTGMALLRRGETLIGAIIFGSIAGGYGAWLVFFIGYRVMRAMR